VFKTGDSRQENLEGTFCNGKDQNSEKISLKSRKKKGITEISPHRKKKTYHIRLSFGIKNQGGGGGVWEKPLPETSKLEKYPTRKGTEENQKASAD